MALSAELEPVCRELVAWARSTLDPVGIVVGEGLRTDLRVFLVHLPPWQIREQRRFCGMSAELFVNPPSAIRGQFVSQHGNGRPSTARMFATGVVVHATLPVVTELVDEARVWLARAPDQTECQRLRYEITDLLDEACDLIDVSPPSATLLLGEVVNRAISLVFWQHLRSEPPTEDLIRQLAALDSGAAELLHEYTIGTAEHRVSVVTALARHTWRANWASDRDNGP